MHAEVEQAKARSGWPARRTLGALGIPPSSYYRWMREEAWAREARGQPPRPPQPYEALPEERLAVKEHALKHPGVRHRELAWKMVDEDVAYLSPSTVYRILCEENLVSPWRRRLKRLREEDEKAGRPDEIWATDLKHVLAGERTYYLISFVDEFSRYVVHHELLRSMDGHTVSLAAQTALETLPKNELGELETKPDIRSDNGSGYLSREFGGVLDEHGLTHRRIKPHCPEENGLVERAHRTFGEALDGEELTDFLQAEKAVGKMVAWYNAERLHSALGFLRPVDYYRGEPEVLREERRRKLSQARHRRRERNLGIRQPTLPFESAEVVA